MTQARTTLLQLSWPLLDCQQRHCPPHLVCPPGLHVAAILERQRVQPAAGHCCRAALQRRQERGRFDVVVCRSTGGGPAWAACRLLLCSLPLMHTAAS